MMTPEILSKKLNFVHSEVIYMLLIITRISSIIKKFWYI